MYAWGRVREGHSCRISSVEGHFWGRGDGAGEALLTQACSLKLIVIVIVMVILIVIVIVVWQG